MAAGELALPRFVALSLGEYQHLRFLDEEGELHSHLRFNGENLVNPHTKFELQRSERGGDAMHIRSAYNNKYWVRKSESEAWVVGTADEPEEDTTKWNCTLFRFVRDIIFPEFYYIIHVASGTYLETEVQWGSWRNVLRIKATHDLNNRVRPSIINLDALVILPRFVTFKDSDGLYLSSRVIRNNNHVQFASNNKFDPSVRYEIIHDSVGTFRMRSLHFNLFLRVVPQVDNFLIADSGSGSGSDAIFSAVRLNGNVIAIRSRWIGNLFWRRSQVGGVFSNCLSSTAQEIDRFCHMEVEEVVSSRQIYDVVFRTEDARIYNHSDGISMIKTVNNPTESEQDGTMSFTYTKTRSDTWNRSVGWSASISTTINTGIPILAQGQITVSASYSGSYSWGQSIGETTQDVASVGTIIPPKTRSVQSVVVTRGAIDVPFSYTQQDTLFSGASDIRRFHDGLFTGFNTHVQSDAHEYALPSTSTALIKAAADDDDQNLSSTTTKLTKDEDNDDQ